MTPSPGPPIPDLMDTPRIISGLSDAASDYDALLCDAWGVIHNGVELYDGVTEALTNFRQQHGPVFILTNAPRMSDVIPPQLDRLGLPRDAYDGIVTSGDATRAAIAQYAGQPALRLGPQKDDTLFEALDLSFVPLNEARFILCTGLLDDQNETPEDYREMLTDARERGLPMVCANPDIIVQFGGKTLYCGGALAQLYEELGGETILCGKPHKPIYDLAAQRLTEAKNGQAPARILAIGDGLQTDILGANRHEIDVIFVAEGIFSEAVRNAEGQLEAERLAQALSENGVHAKAAMERLVW